MADLYNDDLAFEDEETEFSDSVSEDLANSWDVKRERELSAQEQLLNVGAGYVAAEYQVIESKTLIPISELLKHARESIQTQSEFDFNYRDVLTKVDDLFEQFDELDKDIERYGQFRKERLIQLRNEVINDALASTVNLLITNAQSTSEDLQFDVTKVDDLDYLSKVDPRILKYYNDHFKEAHNNFIKEEESIVKERIAESNNNYELEYDEFLKAIKEDPRAAFDSYFLSNLHEEQESFKDEALGNIEENKRLLLEDLNSYRQKMADIKVKRDAQVAIEGLKAYLGQGYKSIRESIDSIRQMAKLHHLNHALESAGGDLSVLDGKVAGLTLKDERGQGSDVDYEAILKELRESQQSEKQSIYLNEFGFYINRLEMDADQYNNVGYAGDWFGNDDFEIKG